MAGLRTREKPVAWLCQWNQWLLRQTNEEDVSFWNAILAMHFGLLDTSFYFPEWLDRSNKALVGGMCSTSSRTVTCVSR
jgi:hypothetical protein